VPRDIIDSVKKLTASGPFAAEEPEGVHLLPFTSCAISIPRVDDPTIQHREVVAEALRILRLLQDNREKLPIQNGAFDLLNLSCSLHELGMWQDAEITCSWAANLYRTLVRGNANPFLSYLALTLNNLAGYRHFIYDHKGALAASHESVAAYRILDDMRGHDNITHSTYRALAEDRPTKFSGELAGALLSNSHYLCRNGQYHDALIASEEGVNLYRSFDGPHSACDFVCAVNDFANCLYEVGNVEQATMVCQEAITICRDIIDDHPRITSTLVSLLATLSDCASSRGQFNEALTSNEEAVSLSRSVPSENPSNLACELRELSVSLLNAGRSQDAMQASEEAVEICRNLPQSQDVSSALAYSLDSLSSCLADAGREEEALAAAEEAVTLYRQMTPNYILRTGCYDHNVAAALYDFAARLAAAGRAADALANTVDAASIYRTVVTTRAVYLPKFATILRSLSVLLWEAGHQDEAIDAWKEEVTVRQRLASTNPDLVPMLHEAMCELPARLSQAKPLAVVCDPLQLEQ